MILTEKWQKYQPYCLVKLINMKILQMKKEYFLITSYCPLEKAFEKQTKTIEEQGKKQI